MTETIAFLLGGICTAAIGFWYYQKRIRQPLLEYKKLGELRSQFAANVSHELKTPLAAIRALSETLLEGALEDPAVNRKMLENIQSQTLGLSKMVDNILYLSRLESISGKPTREDISLRILMEEVTSEFLDTARGREVVIEIDDIPVGVQVLGKRDLLRAILRNLVDNAIKFNRPGGKVTLHAATTPLTTTIEVSDTGFGIPPELHHRIFERFFQVDTSHSGDEGGTGLGLAIVKHAAELLGGQITLESTPGVGSTFRVTFSRT